MIAADVAGIVRPETLRDRAADLAEFKGVLICAPEIRYDDLLAAAPKARQFWPYLRTDVCPGQGPRVAFYNELRAAVRAVDRLRVDPKTGDIYFRRTFDALQRYLDVWQLSLTGLSGWPWLDTGPVFLDQCFTVLPASLDYTVYDPAQWEGGLAFTLSVLVHVFRHRVIGNVGGASRCPSHLLSGACMERAHVLALGAPFCVNRFRALAELGMRENVIFDLAIRAPGVVYSGDSQL